MANEENLIPFNERTESEQRQIAQKGGIASGAARRRKRSMKEAADYYLSLPETDRRRVNALLRDEVDNEDIDNQMSVVMGITEAAKRGDARAAGVLLKMLGEENVDIRDFRYDGPKPQTAEAAILMLSDTVEAAVRALPDPTQEKISALIRKLVRGKMEDGQLDECTLTFRDIGKICSAANTATHAQMATTSRLFRRNARITATTRPVSAEYRLEVE